MQRVAQDVQMLVRGRKDPPGSGAVTIATEKCLRDGDADDAGYLDRPQDWTTACEV